MVSKKLNILSGLAGKLKRRAHLKPKIGKFDTIDRMFEGRIALRSGRKVRLLIKQTKRKEGIKNKKDSLRQ